MPPAPPPASFGPLSGAHPEYRGIYKTAALEKVKQNIKLFLLQHTKNPGPQKPHKPDHPESRPQLCFGGGSHRANAGRWLQVCQKQSCYMHQRPRFVTEPLSPEVLSGLDALFAIQDEIHAYMPRTMTSANNPVARPCVASPSSSLPPSSAPSASPALSPSPALSSSPCRRNRAVPAVFSTPTSQPSSSKRRLSPPPFASTSQASSSKRRLSPPPFTPTSQASSSKRPLLPLPEPDCVSPFKRRKILDVLDELPPPNVPQGIDEAEIRRRINILLDALEPAAAPTSPPVAPPARSPSTPEAVDEAEIFDLTRPDHSQFEETLYPRHDGRLCLNDYKLLLGRQGFEQGLYIEYFCFNTDEWTPCLWATRHLISGHDQILRFRYA
ncbi:hypothetical protein JR316_0000174 [Psilocybe cubensis]|uniref:Uncharacterized protein n=1 Tax=Psilocybe cubensis TaxID=181762 RepID=A0ACB8HG27_PSICU|nr:hypothetical protein JR316_0000174 [Psilocybe cubensis]KAH9486110.1 hypothetical protein JR316_0000174 [Psilocybe cubensis]